MSSQGSMNTPPSFHCTAGIYCQMPHVNYSSSPHKCYFCQKLLHGICGVLHDPDDITYHNHWNSCHKRFFVVSPSGQGVNPSPPVQHTAPPLYPTPPSNVNTAATSIMELSSNSVLYIIPTFVLIQNADRRQIQDSIGHLFMSSLNYSGASTPVFPNGSRNATPTCMDTDGMFDEMGVMMMTRPQSLIGLSLILVRYMSICIQEQSRGSPTKEDGRNEPLMAAESHLHPLA